MNFRAGPSSRLAFPAAAVSLSAGLAIALAATVTRFLPLTTALVLTGVIFVSLAVLASPVGGLIGAVGAAQTGAPFGTVLVRWGLADFFGYCLFAPLMLTWPQWRHFFDFQSPGIFVAVAMVSDLMSFIDQALALRRKGLDCMTRHEPG